MSKRKRVSAETKARKKKQLYRAGLRAKEVTDQRAHQAVEANGAAYASGLTRTRDENSSAFMGRAPPCGENVPYRLDVGLSRRENASECPAELAAPSLGSRLSDRTMFMSQNPASSQEDCATSSKAIVGISSPKNGCADQGQTSNEVPFEEYHGGPSISSFTKSVYSQNNEAKKEYLKKTEQKQNKP